MDEVKKEAIREIKDTPFNELVDFTKELQSFADTHGHLPLFGLIDSELGLIGEQNYSVKKFMTYFVESATQSTFNFQVGKEYYDNRIHGIFKIPVSHGKGRIKRIARFHPNVREINGARVHIEQLIGKKITSRSGAEKELPGDLTYTVLVEDEAGPLLNEEDANMAAIMHEERMALDIYGLNHVEKRLVDNETKLTVLPKIRNLKLVHPQLFTNAFFDRGTARRYFCLVPVLNQIEESDVLSNLFGTPSKGELKQIIVNRWNALLLEKEKAELKVPEDVVMEISEWYTVWNRFLFLHPNARVRSVARGFMFGGLIYFFRMGAILAKIREENTMSMETARLACRDTIHLFLCTIQSYANDSKPTLSRDVWKTEIEEECALLEWMHHNDATSRENTPLSIEAVQDKINDLFGVASPRQARKIYSRLRRNGLIAHKQGRHTSKSWLGFIPMLDSPINYTGIKHPDLISFVRGKFDDGHGGAVKDPTPVNSLNVQSTNQSSSSILEG